MDHAHHDYRASGPLPAGPPQGQGWPLRVYVLLVLEHWEAQPAPEDLRDPRMVGEFGSFTPDWRSWSQREYGLRIGVFRVLDALRDAGLTPAVAAHARVLQRLPRLVQTLQDRGVEWVAHGESATRMMHARMPVDEQRSMIETSVATVTQATGRRPAGWLSQDWGTTPDTFRLLAQAGLRYSLDWTNDDAPFALHTEPAMTAVPLSAEFDDVQGQWMRQLTPHQHADLVLTGFRRLRDEALAGSAGKVFGLALHPWLCGMSSRIGALRSLLRELAATPGVQWTAPGLIADHPCGEPLAPRHLAAST
jgi:peptidoglycan/xylan/chitin deacetylase (PgdA/CDA1 family)